jgi:Cof subfamily protein (haloacid dehalogenase superfamily)
MAYKLICIDIDGTLLDPDSQVSGATKEALRQAHDRGVHIVVSTGRMYTDAAYYSNLIGVRSPVIASNGAFIKEKDHDEVIYQSILGENLLFKILDVFRKYDIKPFFCTPHKFYYGTLYFKLFYLLAKLRGRRRNEIDSEYVFSWDRWRHVLHKEKDRIVKCEIIHRNINSLGRLSDELKNIEQLEIVSSSKYNIEITCKGVSKGAAVEFLANFYHVKREEVIAIGDSANDLFMIEYAGLGVAMGNALEMVKKKADYITDSNDRDGVAKAVNKFVLGNR